MRGCGRLPTDALTMLNGLIDRQDIAARETLSIIMQHIDNPELEDVEIGVSVDDHEAQSIGWPTASAHAAVIHRLMEIAEDPVRRRIRVVPRGATPGTAAAIDTAHNEHARR